MTQVSTPGAQAPGRFVTIAVLLMAAMTIMSNATIAPSLPGLREHFAGRAGIDTLAGLILTLPSLAIILTAGIWGAMADRLNRQWILIASGLLYAIGGTSGLWAGSLEMMLAGRAILGLGVAGTMTLAMTWGSDLWQGPARARFMGLQGASMSAGGIVVMLLGGAAAAIHWRGAFAVYGLVVPVVVIGLIALAPYVAQREANKAQRVAADEAVSEAFPWRTFAFVGPLAFLFMACFYVMPTRLPFLLTDLDVANPLAIAGIMACMTLAAIPGSLAYGRIRRYLSAYWVFALSWFLMGVGMLVIALATGPIVVTLGVLVMGLGMGPSMPNYTTYFMSVVPAGARGRASGLLTTAFFAGQFASPLASAPLVGQFGLVGAFWALSAVMLVIAAVLTVIAMRQRPVEMAASSPV